MAEKIQRMQSNTELPATTKIIAQFSNLLLDLYHDAGVLPAERFQARAFDRLKTLIAFDEGWWAMGMLETAPASDAEYEGPEIFDIYLHDVSPENYTLYKKLKRFDTVVLESERNPGVTLNVRMRDWYPETHWPVLDVYGYFHLLGTHAADPVTGLSSAITLYRRDPDHPFSEQDRSVKQALMPHWIAALNRNKMAPWIRDAAYILHYPAAAILDAGGGLRYATEDFGEMLRREWPDWRGPMLPEALQAQTGCAQPGSSAGGQFLGKHIAAKITQRQHMPLIQLRSKRLSDHLSEQQLNVARHAAGGLSFKEIARLMNLSPATVRYYLSNIYLKLGVKNKVELAEIMRDAE